jgi:ubiquitin-conjugating enzyme E2 O
LEIPLGGLEAEINWLYYTEGRLTKVLRDSQALIQKSQSESEVAEADQNLAVPRLTTGGIIMLERTLSKLQMIVDRT